MTHEPENLFRVASTLLLTLHVRNSSRATPAGERVAGVAFFFFCFFFGSLHHEITPPPPPAPHPLHACQKLTQRTTMDGECVLAKSGRHKWEWLNRSPWRRRKDERYEVHVVEDGLEVRLGERTVWGATSADLE